jgi:aldehyde:ferredoxin oxidoreductase
MNTEYGWAGKILRVDLTERRYWTEPTAKYAERFIGGIGIGYKVFWDEVGAEVGAFDGENRLVFAPGPLTGTLVPGAGRMELVSKSPRSYPRETVTRSGMGGFWGSELKYAGYDALVLQGKSESWVNLYIHDEGVEFREATGYVGEDTYTTQINLRKELGAETRVVCIGPAGERLSRLAVILSETSFASGRSGFGAVMGSKRVKAVAVRGMRPLKIYDPGRLIELSRRVRELSAEHTARDRTTLILNLKEREEYINEYRKKNVACFGCPVHCFAHLSVPDAGQAATHCINYFYHAPATQYYGPSLERDQAVADGFILANKLGLDTFEFWHMVPFLKDLAKAGYQEIESELPADKVGSREFIQLLLHRIALRQGFGDLLAEGCARVAERFPRGWDIGGRYFPAYGSAAHGPLRKGRGVAIMWALDSRCPVIDQHSYIRLSISYMSEPLPYALAPEKAKAISHKVYGSEAAIDPSTFDFKPEAILHTQNRSAVINILVLCDWLYPGFHSYATQDRSGDTSLECQLLDAVTNYGLSEEELNRVGERVWNLSRAIMVKEGRTRIEDTFHESFFQEESGEKGVPKEDFEKAKTRYYRLRGWDEATGSPTKEKLEQLDLADVAQALFHRDG